MALTDLAPARRFPWARWVRLLVSGALLVVLVTKLDLDHFVPAHRTVGTLAFFAGGLALTATSFVLAAWRWQRVLAVFGCHVRLTVLLKHYLAGQFVGNVLPSTIGGDVLRISRSAHDTGARDVAFASVVLERLTGFVALPLLSIIGFLVEPSLFDHTRSWLALLVSASSLVVLAVLLVLAGHPNLAGRFAEHQNWMRYIGAVHVGVDRLRRDLRDAGGALLVAILYQACVVSSVYCAAHALGIRIPDAAVLAFVPAVAMMQVLPISVGGLGVREGLMALFLDPFGIATGRAVALGILWYAMTLAVSFAGAPAFALAPRRRTKSEQSLGALTGNTR